MNRFFAPICSFGCALALAGCAMPSAILSGNTPAVATHQVKIGGTIHGGQQAVIGSTMTLWAAGTGTGYGQGATVLATTTSDTGGNFGFNAGTCTTGQLLYITAQGGNSFSSDPTLSNPYVAAMAAVPQACNVNTPNQFVIVNELSTVAAVWSLQQFMSIAPGATPGTFATTATAPWMIGSPSTNIIGMTNAFAGVSEMVSTGFGTAGPSSVNSTVGGVAYVNTIVPDSNRINALGDILGSCINSDGITADGSQCAALMTDTTPGAATPPSDTIEVAYYLATNPAGLTMPQHATANGSPAYLCANYIVPSPPFMPTTSCTNPGDWTITIQWKNTTVATTPVTVGTIYAGAVALDSNGNVWTGGASSALTANLINQFSPTGTMNIVPPQSVTIPAYSVKYDIAGTTTAEAFAGSSPNIAYARSLSLAVDTLNNAWYSSYGSATQGTLTNGSVSLYTGFVVQVTPTGQPSGYITGVSPGVIAIDGSNNIFLNNAPGVSSGVARFGISELTAASSYQQLNKGLASSSSQYNDVFVDKSNFAWGLYSGTTCNPFPIYRENDTVAASASTANDVTSSVCAYYGAIDAAGNMWSAATPSSGATGNIYYTNISASLTAPTITTFTGGTATTATGTGGQGGLDLPVGVAVDGLGHVWVANRLTSNAATGISEFAPTTTGTTTTIVPLSEGGTVAGQFGFQGGSSVGINGLALDSSGNVWFQAAAGSYLYHMVGAAAPVVTPVSLAIANNALGTRP